MDTFDCKYFCEHYDPPSAGASYVCNHPNAGVNAICQFGYPWLYKFPECPFKISIRQCSNCCLSSLRKLLSGKLICLRTPLKYHVDSFDICSYYIPRVYIRPFIEVRFLLDFDYGC